MMLETKEEFIKKFMPESVIQVDCAQVNLDFTDLSLGDILRNLNNTYPKNSRARNAIISGSMVAAILCKTETLEPLSGLFLILTNDELDIQLVSKNYVVLCISESNITTDEKIVHTIERITRYLANNFKGTLEDLTTFYAKYIYDPTEMEDEEECDTILPKTFDYLLDEIEDSAGEDNEDSNE